MSKREKINLSSMRALEVELLEDKIFDTTIATFDGFSARCWGEVRNATVFPAEASGTCGFYDQFLKFMHVRVINLK